MRQKTKRQSWTDRKQGLLERERARLNDQIQKKIDGLQLWLERILGE